MKTVIEGLEKGLSDIATALGGGSDIVPTPTAQDDGKVLTANDDGTASWEIPDSGLPSTSGHNTNEVLVINDTTVTPPTADWYSLQNVLPDMDPNDYPSNGDVITYNSSTHKAEWQSPQGGGSGLPDITSYDNGKVLQANYDDKSGTGFASWVTPSGGGGGVESTTFTVNGSDFTQHGSSYTVVFANDYVDVTSVLSARIYYSGNFSVPCSIIYADKTGMLAQVTGDDYTYIGSTSGLTLKIFSIS